LYTHLSYSFRRKTSIIGPVAWPNNIPIPIRVVRQSRESLLLQERTPSFTILAPKLL